MVDKIKGTVNLKNPEKNTLKKRSVDLSELKVEKVKKIEKEEESVSQEKTNIDEVYLHEEGQEVRDFKKIEKPNEKRGSDSFYKKITFLLFIVLICAVLYFIFFNNDNILDKKAEESVDENWYAVKLITGDIYYGKINKIEADPLVLKSVYYDYDQLKKEEGVEEVSSSMRLVKRGKEAHGPDGTMNIIRAQVLFIEPLKEESKVLRAILEYEK